MLFYLNIIKVNVYIGEGNGKKYLTLDSTDENKNILKMYEERWDKIRDFITSLTNNKLNASENYDEEYIKTKCNSDNDLGLKNTLEREHGNSW